MKLFYSGLDDDIKKILLAQVRDIWTHDSTAIEGNSLTLGDTAFVLEEGLTIGGKPLRDHQEVFGHAKGIELIYRFLDSDQLREEDIFALHHVVIAEPVSDIMNPVGAWKKESNFTKFIGRDGTYQWRQFPDPDNVPVLMRQWLDRFNSHYAKYMSRMEASSAYADLHLDFVTIHPFVDGNGRMARLLANLPVLRSGFPPIVVPSVERQEYKKAISEYQETIPDLDRITDMESLPDNRERRRFRELCESYWEPTMALVEKAHEIQVARDHQRKKKNHSLPARPRL